MFAILCLGNRPNVHGPFDNIEQAYNWVNFHMRGADVCKNSLDIEGHDTTTLWPVFCRVCGAPLNYDQDNHPEDINLCWYHNDVDLAREHQLV